MRTKEIELAGQTWTLQERTTRKNEQYRQLLEEELAPVVEIIKQSAGLEIAANNLQDLAPAAEKILEIALRSPTKIRDLVIAYSPELQAVQEEILEEAYDSEFAAAFMEVLGLAYPFGSLVQMLVQLSSGQETNGQ